MSKGILGKKLGMTGYFAPNGQYIPITVIEAGPCFVTQIKTLANDGYTALQLGFDPAKAHRVNKPMAGHFSKSGGQGFKVLQEFIADQIDAFKLGDPITIDIFNVGERVDISGTMKGRGFAGVIKRHGFHGGRATHGGMSHRIPGSIGTSAWPSRVMKGRKMPGHYGNTRKTIRNLQIIELRPAENLILVKGAIPGHASGLVEIRKRNF